MREFFGRYGAFLIIVSIIGPLVAWSLYKERKEQEKEKKKQEQNNLQEKK